MDTNGLASLTPQRVTRSLQFRLADEDKAGLFSGGRYVEISRPFVGTRRRWDPSSTETSRVRGLADGRL